MEQALYLAHHGVMGMKWGVWNAETQRKYGGGTTHGRKKKPPEAWGISDADTVVELGHNKNPAFAGKQSFATKNAFNRAKASALSAQKQYGKTLKEKKIVGKDGRKLTVGWEDPKAYAKYKKKEAKALRDWEDFKFAYEKDNPGTTGMDPRKFNLIRSAERIQNSMWIGNLTGLGGLPLAIMSEHRINKGKDAISDCLMKRPTFRGDENERNIRVGRDIIAELLSGGVVQSYSVEDSEGNKKRVTRLGKKGLANA